VLHNLRKRLTDERGFTLIELLVVILIIGILAAIALPAFLNQREKAQDSDAKSSVRTAQTALETYYTDNQSYKPGSLTEADVKDAIVGIEPALQNANALEVVAADKTGYTVSVTSKGNNANVFSISNDKGVVTRSCVGTGGATGKGACPTSGSW
jgi:type IV pilus assembly protein PilA